MGGLLYNARFEMVITFESTVYPDGAESYTENGDIMIFPIPDEFHMDHVDENGNFIRLPEYLLNMYTLENDYEVKTPIAARIQRATSLKRDLFLFAVVNNIN
uniref:Uncharacterized protein n=1 Tax=viral metagenome TaxID=1070528 RepID=A0A6C0JWF2_9ZZZZ